MSKSNTTRVKEDSQRGTTHQVREIAGRLEPGPRGSSDVTLRPRCTPRGKITTDAHGKNPDRLAGRLADVFFVALACNPRKQRTQLAVDNGYIEANHAHGLFWRHLAAKNVVPILELHDGSVPAGPNGIRFDARDYRSSPFRLVRYFLCSEK
ncbi:uncharacterized protein PpBr36_11018 [Pyricularia pennisetigena]|uniref:uncharacterized protein n=1 Tax=Pyricularia pennisetigena TaxID=1578925 RepID=UPI001151F2BE|nr:uncharacterized protein PpBr36_11018 [Pyricularia pennisetigena]TLS20670.1 hypothetical protein PpBr36_11018 [Pyricularia pennisetigena]